MGVIRRILAVNKHEILIAVLATMAVLLYIAVFTYIFFAKDLESKDGIMNKQSTGLVLTDQKDRPFFKFYQANYKKFVPLSEISPHIKNAVIAAEDKDFYQHPGFDIKAIIAAFIANVKKQELAYGGSTITQQLVKNSLLHKEKSFLRKYQEIILAQEIDRRYSKNEILEMYLNSVYFGEGAFGIDAASQTYFGKPSHDLTVAESALLAGLLTAPTELNPLNGKTEKVFSRQKAILQKMYEQGYITKEEKEKAEKEQISFKGGQPPIPYKAPHFALMVKDELVKRYGEEAVARSGLKVKTSIDLDWQDYAEKTVADQVEKLKSNNASNAAAVVIDPKSGEIKALVGSKSWSDNKFGKINMAVSPRQPGSSIKPLIYAAALEDNVITPSTILQDQPTTFKEDKYSESYNPKNYDGKFRGNVLPRKALALSLNVPAVEVLYKIGVERGIEQIKRMGATTMGERSNYGLSLVLGGVEVPLVEMAGAYSIFANQGRYTKPVAITKIEDKYGQTIYEHRPDFKQVIPAQVAYQISSFLSDNSARQEVFGNTLTINRTAAVKTGTTDDYRDAWTLGYTPSLVVGVWVGNSDYKPMDSVAGSLGAAPIWKSLMTKFSEGKADEKFEIPEGMVKLAICSNNGLKVQEATNSAYIEYYIPGTEPSGFCYLPKPQEKKLEEDKKTQPEEKREEQKPDQKEEKKEDRKQDKPQGGSTVIEIQVTQPQQSTPPVETVPPPQTSPPP